MSVETVKNVKPKLKERFDKPSDYNIVMFNDDYTTMEFVEEMLKTHFNKNSLDAHDLMMQVHLNGRAIAGTYSRQIAETKWAEATDYAKSQGHAFRMDLEKA